MKLSDITTQPPDSAPKKLKLSDVSLQGAPQAAPAEPGGGPFSETLKDIKGQFREGVEGIKQGFGEAKQAVQGQQFQPKQLGKGALEMALGAGQATGAIGSGVTQANVSDPLRRAAAEPGRSAKGAGMLNRLANVTDIAGGFVTPGLVTKPLEAAKVLEGAKVFSESEKLANLRLGAQEARQAGYVLPPSMAKKMPGETDALLAAPAGDAKLAQLASAKNQEVTNNIARKDLGLGAGTPLLPDTFRQVRQEAGQAYQDVNQAVPMMDAGGNKAFRRAVNSIDSQTADLKRLFPETSKTPEIDKLKSELLNLKEAPTETLVEKVKSLRADAKANFKGVDDPDKLRLALAQRKAADAIEDLIEDNVTHADRYFAKEFARVGKDEAEAKQAVTQANQALTVARGKLSTTRGNVYAENSARRAQEAANQQLLKAQAKLSASQAEKQQITARLRAAQADTGKGTLVQRLKDARVRIAKSYDYETAANETTGDIDAHRLAAMYDKGKPYTGGIKTIAQTARGFPHAMREPSKFGGVKKHSAVDYLATLALATHHPVAAGAIVARPVSRHVILSKAYQNRMIPKPKTDLEALSSK